MRGIGKRDDGKGRSKVRIPRGCCRLFINKKPERADEGFLVQYRVEKLSPTFRESGTIECGGRLRGRLDGCALEMLD